MSTFEIIQARSETDDCVHLAVVPPIPEGLLTAVETAVSKGGAKIHALQYDNSTEFDIPLQIRSDQPKESYAHARSIQQTMRRAGLAAYITPRVVHYEPGKSIFEQSQQQLAAQQLTA